MQYRRMSIRDRNILEVQGAAEGEKKRKRPKDGGFGFESLQ